MEAFNQCLYVKFAASFLLQNEFISVFWI